MIPKLEEQPRPGRVSIKQLKEQLDRLTVKLKQYEDNGSRCLSGPCLYLSDGLRLSQEVEVLRKQNAALSEENGRLREELSAVSAERSVCGSHPSA
jgi:hypothetical protein